MNKLFLVAFALSFVLVVQSQLTYSFYDWRPGKRSLEPELELVQLRTVMLGNHSLSRH